MEDKKCTINRQSYKEARKPVYVLSEQYETISSEDDETSFAMQTEESPRASHHAQGNEWNFLDEVSLGSLEIPSGSSVNELLEDTEEDGVDDQPPEVEAVTLLLRTVNWTLVEPFL